MIGKNSYLSISTNGMGLGNYIKYITWKTCRTLKFRRILFSDMFNCLILKLAEIFASNPGILRQNSPV